MTKYGVADTALPFCLFVCRTAALREPPCPGRQVGEGVLMHDNVFSSQPIYQHVTRITFKSHGAKAVKARPDRILAVGLDRTLLRWASKIAAI